MDRRSLLASMPFAAAGMLATPTGAHASDASESFLLIHGAWHASTHWNKVVEHLLQMAHGALALDLPGSGLNALYPHSYLTNDWNALETEPSPLRDLRLKDYVDAVVPVVERLASSQVKVTLVGHSFGGLTITLVAERIPHLIERLVYVTAYCPTLQAPGSAAAYNTLPENKMSKSGDIQIGNPEITGCVRINPRSFNMEYLEKGRQAFYNDVEFAEYVKFAVYLNPDLSLKAALDDARGTRERWGSIPRSFVRCTLDQAIPIALQDRMITEADEFTPGNRFMVRTLDSSHSPFASMPEKLARILTER